MRPRAVAAAALVALAALVLGGCGAAADAPVGSADSAGPAAGSPAETSVPACEPAPLEERAAAVLMLGLPEVVSPDDALPVSLLRGGVRAFFVSESNALDAGQLTAFTAALRERAGEPVLVATDEESGRVSMLRDLVGSGPSARTLAATGSPEDTRAFAADLGRKMRELGVGMDLAPSLDLDEGPYDGVIGDRSFSADPATAAAHGLAFARGLADAGVVPVVKHFPGQGPAAGDTHTDSTVVTAPLAQLRAHDLVPFQEAVDAGVPVVMVNHVSYRALDAEVPASLSDDTYALLREMGFTGVAMTDSIGMGAVNLRWDFPEAAVRAVAAGADLVLATDGNQGLRMRDALVRAVRGGSLPEERLDEAAARVTALAGGDPGAISCLDVRVPTLRR